MQLQHAVLDGVEELLCLRERQTQMLNASVVFLQGDDIGDRFFLAIITKNALQFDAHRECSSGSGGGGMMEVILPGFVAYPQLLHALDRPLCGGGQIAQEILHALQAAVQIGVHERPEEPRAWASTDARTTEKKWPGQARPRVTVETGDLPACPEFVRACSTASGCD